MYNIDEQRSESHQDILCICTFENVSLVPITSLCALIAGLALCDELPTNWRPGRARALGQVVLVYGRVYHLCTRNWRLCGMEHSACVCVCVCVHVRVCTCVDSSIEWDNNIIYLRILL